MSATELIDALGGNLDAIGSAQHSPEQLRELAFKEGVNPAMLKQVEEYAPWLPYGAGPLGSWLPFSEQKAPSESRQRRQKAARQWREALGP